MLMALAELRHSVYPVSIVIPVFPVTRMVRLVVVQLIDRRRGGRILGLVVQFLFQHHGILVTVEQFIGRGLPGACKLIAVVHLGLASRTALGLDLDDTVGTLGTPHSRRGSILQNRDPLR